MFYKNSVTDFKVPEQTYDRNVFSVIADSTTTESISIKCIENYLFWTMKQKQNIQN